MVPPIHIFLPGRKRVCKPKFTDSFGGDEEDRTLDLTDANRALSQLSYAPKLWNLFNFSISFCASCQVAGARFADSLLSQLSYAPKQSSCDNVNYYIIIFIVWQEGRKKKMEISVLFSRLNVSD